MATYSIDARDSTTGQVEAALPWLRRAGAEHERWADLLPRLPASGLLPVSDQTLARLVDAAKR